MFSCKFNSFRNEVMPAVIYGKSGQVSEVPVDYFVVNVNNGFPIEAKFSTLKAFDFPKENRAKLATVTHYQNNFHRKLIWKDISRNMAKKTLNLTWTSIC